MEELPDQKPPKSHFFRSLAIFAILGAVVILIGTSIYLYQTGKFPFLQKKQRIKIPATEVSLVPTAADTLGVDPQSAFILASKDVLDPDAVKLSLTIEPAIPFNVKPITDNELNISLARPPEKNRIYRFQLATLAEDLSWAFQIKDAFRIVQTLPRNQATAVPLNSGIEITFSHQNVQDLSSFFELIPKVEGRFETHKRTTVFVPRGLEAGTLYTAKIKKGLGVQGSNETLKDDYIFQFETDSSSLPKARYRIGFVREISEFPKTETPAFSLYLFYSEKTPSLGVAVYKFQDINQFIDSLKERDKTPPWARFSRETFLYEAKELEKVLSFEAPVQKIDYSGYFVFPQSLPDGYYLVEVSFEDQKLQTWLQITDVASYLSTSDTKTLAWINDVSRKEPSIGTTVQLIDGQINEETDTKGVALFDTPEELLDTAIRRYFKVTTQDNKTAVIPITQTFQYYYYYGGRYDYQSGPTDQYWSYLYLDREIYLPSDTLSYWGLIKDRDHLKTAVEGLKLILTRSDYRDYYYQPVAIFQQDLGLSELGTFIGEVPLRNLETGSYFLEIKKGEDTITSNYFSVQTYTKPAYKIDIEPTKKAVFAGESLNFDGKTTFFEGTRVPEVKLNYSGAIEGETTTDENGEFTLTYLSEYRENDEYGYPIYYPISRYLHVTPVLAEEGEIEGGVSVLVFGPKIALKVDTETNNNTGRVKMTVNEITLDRLNDGTDKDNSDYLGDPAAGWKITGKLYENRWEKEEVGEYYDFINKVVRKKYHYKNIKNFLADISETTNSEGQAQYQFLMAEDKYYQIELQSEDSSGRKAKQTVYLYGRHGHNPQSSDYYHLESNKSSDSGYQPSGGEFSLGETVSLTFKKGQEILPEGGDNQYLFRLAQRGLREHKIQNSPIYNFNFADSHVPNTVAKAIYFNGKTFIESDSLSLNFKKEDKKLSIEINPDKKEYRPSDEVNLDVLVRDKDQQGKKSEVNISLVDEALFKLREQYVDTLGTLYRSIASGVIQSYASHQYPLEKAGAEGGGCFLAGTKILLPDEKQKNIEDIKVGDKILTRESERSSRLLEAEVVKTFRHIVGEYLLLNGFLRVTPEHNLFVNGRWTVAADIKLGDYLLDNSDHWIKVTSIENRKGNFEVYNLEIAEYKTFFADNFYVHNQKGRELFMDKAFFGVVETDQNGRGKVSFKLPDNLTSWRITYQGISESLGAGSGTRLIPVELPFFVDAVLNLEYLVADKPVVKLRSFGENLKEGDAVEFTVKAPSLGLAKGQKLKSNAFEAVSFTLPDLSEGEHKITITGRSGQFEDTLTRSINVYKTRLTRGEANYYLLKEETKVEGSRTQPTTLIFSDQNRGKYYAILRRLAYTYGDRVDQKLARIKARELLLEYFNEEIPQEEFRAANYQTDNGGLTLFPYSDADLALSAKIASISNEYFDKESLKQYFYRILDDPNEGRERTTIALFGLASLGEPVLVTVNNLTGLSDLTPQEKLYLGLAAAQLGNREKGREILNTILVEYGEEFQPFVRINVGVDQDDVLEATALGSNLATFIDAGPQEGLFQYVLNNATKDILIYLEELIFARNSLPRLSGEGAQFSYILDDKKVNKKLEKGQLYKIQVTPEQLNQIKFDDIQGNVGLTSFFKIPLAEKTQPLDKNIAVNRFYIGDQNREEFYEADLVKVVLNYSFSDKALDGCYQVSDFLPSGLQVLSRPYSRGIEDSDVWYPYEIEKQKVSFCVYKDQLNQPITYYARVISKGEYEAESAIIQSLKSADSYNISNSSSVTIK